ncbi:MAG TPA: tetratricopeptide repeat protein, partial [Bacteroidia bacterium]|nr:tetratricopeptide repeat protein [Bacteroidia bacterium]
MDKVDVQAWLKREVDEIVKLYENGKRGEALGAFSAVVGKGRFQNLVQEEKEAAFLKPLEVFAANWEEKEGLVIAGRIRAWKNDYLGAVEKFDQAIAIDAKYGLAYSFRGNACSNLGDKQKALQDYDKAIALDPDYAITYSNRGMDYSDLGENQKALLDYEKAIALDPEDANAYSNRGNCYSALGDEQKALLDYDKAIVLDPEYSDAYNNRGNAFFELGDNQRALLDYDKAITLDPNDAIPYSNRGNAYLSLGDKQKALLDYGKAIALDPSQADTYYNRSLILEEQVDFKEAIQDLDQYLKLETDPFWIDRAKARLVDLEAKLKHPTVRKVGALVEEIRKLLRFEGAEITHYTSFSAAKLMILDKSPFRMSEATFMNDPSEGTMLLGFLFKGKADPLDEGHFDGRFVGKPFFGSFVDASANMQDDLGMWRLYGKEYGAEAAGTSLTFDSQALV